jgi:flavin reductase (DIM6/NTAB) family NADH-FMN oxidoreductase RutF
MTHLDLPKIEQLPSRFRANFINSITGYKSCNLIGTRSEEGTANLAIFSSLLHIGSSPALLGFLLRPLTVRRDTFTNITKTGRFTVNQVSQAIFKAAHQTAAKYDTQVSEFDAVGLTEQYLDNFNVPYVGESSIKIGCSYSNHYTLEENGCILVTGTIEHVYYPEEIQHPDGFLQLDISGTLAAMGMDGYALPAFLNRFSYSKPGKEPQYLLHDS